MEIPPKKDVGRKPDPTKSTLYMREYWRRRYYKKKAERAQTSTRHEEEGET